MASRSGLRKKKVYSIIANFWGKSSTREEEIKKNSAKTSRGFSRFLWEATEIVKNIKKRRRFRLTAIAGRNVGKTKKMEKSFQIYIEFETPKVYNNIRGAWMPGISVIFAIPGPVSGFRAGGGGIC